MQRQPYTRRLSGLWQRADRSGLGAGIRIADRELVGPAGFGAVAASPEPHVFLLFCTFARVPAGAFFFNLV